VDEASSLHKLLRATGRADVTPLLSACTGLLNDQGTFDHAA
jgi:hypothetical protein